MRILLALATTLVLGLGLSVRADEGGYQDPQTGKVWSPSQYYLYGSTGNWLGLNIRAENYSVWDYNDQNVLTLYEDWRLPTLTELQTAVQNGTIQTLHNMFPAARNMSYWTSTKKGQRYAAIRLTQDANGIITGTEVIWIHPSNTGYNAFCKRP